MQHATCAHAATAPPAAVRAVLFDLGGVWVRLRPWQEACAFAGFDPQTHIQLARMDDHPQVARLHLQYEHGQLSTCAFTQQTGAILGASAAAVEAVFCARIEQPFPGTHALLDQLAARRITTGCLSNTNALHWALMQGVLGDDQPQRIPVERLHHRFVSQELGFAKPNADIYRSAEQVMGLCGAQVAFFDDRDDNIAAAKAMGWQARRIDPDARDAPATQIHHHLTRMGVFS